MKTERNGILETAWRKIKDYFGSRLFLFDLYSLSLLICLFSFAFVSLITLAYVVTYDGEIPYAFVACCVVSGLCASSFCLSAVLHNKISSFILSGKSSGSDPDENIKNTKMEGNCENEKND